MKINKVLIANRGEIACRIMQTAHEQKIKTVAIYTAADKGARHTRMANEIYAISNYLNIHEIITIAKKAGANAIHLGYGFLAENYLFAKRLEREKIKFIGPSASAVKLMGKKDLAKQLAKKIGVLVVMGYSGKQQGRSFLAKQASKIGYPILIKASSGGGGKGMRKVLSKKDFQQALASAKSEAKKLFGNEHVILEKYIEKPKHIEVQIFGDRFGNVVHMFERDCTVQRKYQKVIEEATASFLNEKQRADICKVACKIARAVKYEGAGTVEFIFDSKTRSDAIKRLQKLLLETFIFGIDTNISFLLAILANKKFQSGNFDTGLIEKNIKVLAGKNKLDESLIVAGIAELTATESDSMADIIDAWQNDSFQLFVTPIINFQCQIKGDLLFSLEAMKMEHSIYAKTSGTVAEVKIKIGEQVKANERLIKIK